MKVWKWAYRVGKLDVIVPDQNILADLPPILQIASKGRVGIKNGLFASAFNIAEHNVYIGFDGYITGRRPRIPIGQSRYDLIGKFPGHLVYKPNYGTARYAPIFFIKFCAGPALAILIVV